jgi:hypothetical protein
VVHLHDLGVVGGAEHSGGAADEIETKRRDREKSDKK